MTFSVPKINFYLGLANVSRIFVGDINLKVTQVTKIKVNFVINWY